MAEFKFSAFFTYLIHRKIYDPAEFIAFPVHMAFRNRSDYFYQCACRLKCISFTAGRKSYKISRFQTQSTDYSIFPVSEEFRYSARKTAVFSQSEPVCLSS